MEDNWKQIKIQPSGTIIYIVSAKDFMKVIKWNPINRKLNKKHINEICQEYKRNGDVMGNFQIIKDNEENLFLQNGHHRCTAIQKLLKVDPNIIIDDLIVEVRKVSSFDDEISTSLFLKSNNVLNVPETENPNAVIIKVINNLIDIFSTGDKKSIIRKADADKRVNRPFINYNDLYTQLVDSNIIKEHKLSAKELVDKILRKNNEYKVKYNSIKNDTIVDKARKYNFFLGIQLKDKFKWVREIRLELN